MARKKLDMHENIWSHPEFDREQARKALDESLKIGRAVSFMATKQRSTSFVSNASSFSTLPTASASFSILSWSSSNGGCHSRSSSITTFAKPAAKQARANSTNARRSHSFPQSNRASYSNANATFDFIPSLGPSTNMFTISAQELLSASATPHINHDKRKSVSFTYGSKVPQGNIQQEQVYGDGFDYLIGKEFPIPEASSSMGANRRHSLPVGVLEKTQEEEDEKLAANLLDDFTEDLPMVVGEEEIFCLPPTTTSTSSVGEFNQQECDEIIKNAFSFLKQLEERDGAKK